MQSDPERISIRGMDYAPRNELGVVFLFALLAPQLGFKGLERIQTRFPDAIARRRASQGEERVKIEFEYKSSNFVTHRHSKRGCVTIVCWIHDWPEAPANINVIELRKYVGLSFEVWIQAVSKEYWHHLDRNGPVGWSVPKCSKRGDLIIFYRRSPSKFIQELYVQTSPTTPDKKFRWSANLRKVCKFAYPISLDLIKQHRGLRGATFVRANFMGRFNATGYWPDLYLLFLSKNKNCRGILKKYAPEFL